MDTPENAGIVCSACGFINEPEQHYCEKCGGPISAHAVLDPFDTIRTQGWAYRKASSEPRKGIVVVGIWMIFGPMLICSVGGVLLTLGYVFSGKAFQRPGELWPTLLMLGLSLVGFYISGTLVLQTTNNFLAKRAQADGEEDDVDDEENRFDGNVESKEDRPGDDES